MKMKLPGLAIRRVQVVPVTLSGVSGGPSTQNATIPIAVDMSRAVVMPLSNQGDSASGPFITASAYVFNATTLRVIYEVVAGPVTVTVYFAVVEFEDAPRSIQYFTGASSPVTLGTALVSTAKAFMWCTAARRIVTDGVMYPTINSTTQVTFNTTSRGGALVWYLVEGF